MKRLWRTAKFWPSFLLLGIGVGSAAADQQRFLDDFEAGLRGWRLGGAHAIAVVDSGDPAHGRVLELRADGLVYALVRGSDRWGPVRVEADFLFPEELDHYLGLVYNWKESAGRVDFGNIYVKGGDSYLRVNPFRDGNASRLLYEEYYVRLSGADTIALNRWHRFKAEISGRECHFYIGDMTTPRLTFDLFEGERGLVGFTPRIVGGRVLLDNVRVTSIEALSYQGPPIPAVSYQPESLLTDWEVLGPLPGPLAHLEHRPVPAAKAPSRRLAWRPFATDRRGAVLTGRVTEYAGGRPVAYFRTHVRADSAKDAVLHFSTTDELALFVNGSFQGFVYRDGYVSGDNDWNAWFDFWKNPKHAGRKVTIKLRNGNNEIMVRVRNGEFASGGFFARMEEPVPAQSQ